MESMASCSSGCRSSVGRVTTQTATLVEDLGEGRLDVALLSLPVERAGLETLALFDDPFLLAVPANTLAGGAAVTPETALSGVNLLLLEEGHCLRDQALSFCGATRTDQRRQYGASSLSTIMQMVANGFGTTLMPAMALAVEWRPDMPVKLFRFAEPQPSRAIGLVWRRTSPRRRDFKALGAIIREVAGNTFAAGERSYLAQTQLISLP